MGVRVHPQTACACSRAPVWDRESATRDHDREVTHGNWAPSQLIIDAHPRTSLRLVGPNILYLACSAVDGGGVGENVCGPKREADGCGMDSDDRSSVTRPASVGTRMLYLGGRDHLPHRPLCRLRLLLNLLRRSSDASGDCWHAGYNLRTRNHPATPNHALRRRRALRTRVCVAENSGSISRE